MDLAIIVVSYNVKERLRRCLASIPDGVGRHTAEVVVVDNASADGSPELVEAEFASVRLIRSPENLGFAAGVNVGAAATTGAHVILLNPDAELHPGAVGRLVEATVARPGHPVYGGRTVRRDGTTDRHSCLALPTVWSTVCFSLGLTTAFPGSRRFDPESLAWLGRHTTREVEAVSGSFQLVPRNVWEALGGFDERYFMYSEDVDFCLRGTELTGRRPLFVAEATAIHESGSSSADHAAKSALVVAGRATFIRLHWRPPARWAGLLLLQAGVALRAGTALALRGRATASQRSWVGVWRARRRWRWGYPLRGSA